MHQEFEPPEELRDAIKCFWYDSKEYGAEGSGFTVMPDGYAEIIFHFGSGCSVVGEDGGTRALPSPFLMGLLNRPVEFFAKGRLEIVGVRCFPWTVFDLLGLAAGGKGAVRVFEHPIAGIQAVLGERVRTGEIGKVVKQLRQYLLDVRQRVTADSMLFKAGVAMRKANGTLPVREVAAAAHATVRTLERNFKQSSGHTVKDVSALMRFEQVRNRLWIHPDTGLAGLAQELGYADQSHLSREFKRYSGTTPGAFARKAKKGQRMVADDFVAFVQA
jgi:AraC-like DNA-binding protein